MNQLARLHVIKFVENNANQNVVITVRIFANLYAVIIVRQHA